MAGYCVPVLLSGVALATFQVGGDIVSVLCFAVAQALLFGSPRWGICTLLGFTAGWSLGTGGAFAAGYASAIVQALLTRQPLTDPVMWLLVFPAAGLFGGLVAATVASAVQLAGGRSLRARRWIPANAAGGAPAGIALMFAFASPTPVAKVAALAGCALAGAAWGVLVAQTASPTAIR